MVGIDARHLAPGTEAMLIRGVEQVAARVVIPTPAERDRNIEHVLYVMGQRRALSAIEKWGYTIHLGTETEMKYKSDVVLGERYRDSQSGFEGVATGIFFYQYGCERVQLEAFVEREQDIKAIAFDAPRLVHVSSGKVPKVERTGGPGSGLEARPSVTR